MASFVGTLKGQASNQLLFQLPRAHSHFICVLVF